MVTQENADDSNSTYIDGFQYTNGDLDFFPHAACLRRVRHEREEDTVEVTSTGFGAETFNYVFHYTDHLGNIRLRYAANPENRDEITILEEKHYYPFGLQHEGYSASPRGFGFSNNDIILTPVNPFIGSSYKYGFGGKEYQDELDLNLYDVSARNYDPALGRWMNIDPLAEKMRRHSPYNFAFYNPVYWTDPDGMMPVGQQPPYVRLMFYGGSTKDDALFLRAAQNVNNDYSSGGASNYTQIENAQTIINGINSQEDNSVQSVDIFSHGGDEQLYFDRNILSNDLYENSDTEPWYSSSDAGSLDDINFDKFTNNAKVEIHGCNTCSITDSNEGDNFGSNFSKKLFDAGKENAVVIGHVDYTNPDGHENLKGDDYRHGVRRVYHNGDVLFRTKQEGRISAKTINSYLNKKQDQGDDYNGLKQKTWE